MASAISKLPLGAGGPMTWFAPVLRQANDTVIVGAGFGLKRDDGSASQPGDVLSCQGDGTWQTRPPGTDGPYEKMTVNGATACYYPQPGTFGPFVFAWQDEIPNV